MRLNLEGKTGRRTILVIESCPYIQRLLEIHPRPSDPESYLFIKKPGNPSEPLQYSSAGKILEMLKSKSGLHKPLNPHWFRKSRISFVASKKKWTSPEMETYFGWVQGSSVSRFYIKFGNDSLDDRILSDAGIKTENMKKETKTFRTCPRGHKNLSEAKFCADCGLILDSETAISLAKKEENLISRPEFNEQLLVSLIKQTLIDMIQEKNLQNKVIEKNLTINDLIRITLEKHRAISVSE